MVTELEWDEKEGDDPDKGFDDMLAKKEAGAVAKVQRAKAKRTAAAAVGGPSEGGWDVKTSHHRA